MWNGVRNAIVESVKIDDADRDMLSAWLFLDYGGSGQGFGGHLLYRSLDDPKNYCGHFIKRCMEIAGANSWEGIRGKSIRVEIKDGLIVAIGHILKDDWFNPKKDFGEN